MKRQACGGHGKHDRTSGAEAIGAVDLPATQRQRFPEHIYCTVRYFHYRCVLSCSKYRANHCGHPIARHQPSCISSSTHSLKAPPKILSRFPCVSTSMIRKIWHTLVALIFFACQAQVAAVVCDPMYGTPIYTACHELLYNRPGIARFDSRDHGFMLPLTPRPPWWNDAQWDNRRYVPDTWFNGRHKPPSYLSWRSFASVANDTYFHPLPDACRIALIPGILASGEFATDTGRWSNIASDAAGVFPVCIRDRTGGIQATGIVYWPKLPLPRLRLLNNGMLRWSGDHRLLSIVIYAGYSVFDNATRGLPFHHLHGPKKPTYANSQEISILHNSTLAFEINTTSLAVLLSTT